MNWTVIHDQAQIEYGRHKTKKAATAAAKEMTEAHAAINAKHEGKPITFSVEKSVALVDDEVVSEDET